MTGGELCGWDFRSEALPREADGFRREVRAAPRELVSETREVDGSLGNPYGERNSRGRVLTRGMSVHRRKVKIRRKPKRLREKDSVRRGKEEELMSSVQRRIVRRKLMLKFKTVSYSGPFGCLGGSFHFLEECFS